MLALTTQFWYAIISARFKFAWYDNDGCNLALERLRLLSRCLRPPVLSLSRTRSLGFLVGGLGGRGHPGGAPLGCRRRVFLSAALSISFRRLLFEGGCCFNGLRLLYCLFGAWIC